MDKLTDEEVLEAIEILKEKEVTLEMLEEWFGKL